jgi:hypothetical protein
MSIRPCVEEGKIMSKTIQSSVENISNSIPHAETAIDAAMVSVAHLMASLVQARIDNNVPAATGQASLLRLAKTQMSLVGVSGDVLRVHNELLDIGKVYCRPDIHQKCEGSAKDNVSSHSLKAVA